MNSKFNMYIKNKQKQKHMRLWKTQNTLLSGHSVVASLDNVLQLPNGLIDTPVSSPSLPACDSYKKSLTPQQRFKQESI
jgi:hypothetical protein